MFTSSSQRARGILAILTAALIWGTLPLVLRHVDGAPIITVFYRVFFGFVAISIVLAVTGSWRTLLDFDRGTIKALAVQGIILGINWALFMSAFSYANVALVELLAYLGPVLVPLMAPFIASERFDRRIIIPLGLSLSGTAVVLASHGLQLSGGQWFGALLATGSAFTYALLMTRNKRFVTLEIPPVVVVWYTYLVASLLLLGPTVWQYSVGNAPTGGLNAYFWLVVIGFVHTAFAIVLFLTGVRHVRIDQGAVLTYLEPVSAVIFAALFLGEHLTPLVILGALLVVAGGTLVARMAADSGTEMVPIEAVS